MTRIFAIAALSTTAFASIVATEPSLATPGQSGGASHAHPTASVAKVAAANKAATVEPAQQSFINAVQVYPYHEGTIYRVYTAPERVTDIALQPGEVLGAVASGDTVRWVIGDTTSGSGDTKRTHVLVKPFAAGLSTNLVITTDRRSYHLQLTSTGKTAMAGLSWSYPQDALIALERAQARAEAAAPVAAGLQLEQLDFNYAVSGDRPTWRPLRAFDDGRQTFIEFPATLAVGEAPPLFLVDGNGEAQLVNYRVKGRFYIVDRLFDVAELRLGTKEQTVVRVTRIAAEKRARRGS
ncbi:P-type conjugative transfer protein TrbG [Sphingomonas gilva]|uniref:P-type conjugative transfer protein TrbG n=1 Tax=Sphingomonas gilva TaxID=2305907 RepID=A0A396RP07_9SPHN|nr:P-type conjugative transfer protein TrbG [Sphingomonas gilva]RHW18168.1 P-type conjugative transfer protein TrbG [Sphingomonas gilva]